MKPTIVLFDLDGTLAITGLAGLRVMIDAFVRRHGRQDVFDFVSKGMTDRQIMREALVRAGIPDDESEIAALLQTYLGLLPAALERSTEVRELPGVAELLDRLAALPEVAVGLGTGNIEAGARLKLQRVGLAGRFAFGGYSSDAEQRPALLRIGARRGADRLGRRLTDCRLVVVGDTPRDVEAARAVGAASLAVATGGFAADELAAAGADLVVETLQDPAVLSWITDQGMTKA